MRNLAVLSLVISLCVASISLWQYKSRPKFGYVEIGKVVENYDFAKDARKEIEDEKAKIEKDSKRLSDSLDTIVQKVKGLSPGASKKRIQQLQAEYLQMRGNQERYAKISHEKLSKLEQDKMAPVYEKINAFLGEFGKKKGNAFVFGATGSGSLMHADNAYNLTGEVIEAMNAKK